MIKNYFKTTIRFLVQHKGVSFINIFGLSIGMCFAILIGMWIQYEMSFDKFHVNRDRIARVMKHTLFNNQRNTQESTPLPLHDELKTNFPEVEKTSRVDWGGSHSLVVGDRKFNKEGSYVDPDYLEMFTFPIIKGDKKTALEDPYSIVLTESLTKTLFGSQDPLGKTVRIDNKYDVKVTAVVKDVPLNSTIQFEFLAPYEFLVLNNGFVKNNKTNWSNNFLMNFVELKDGVSMEEFSRKIGPLNVQKDSKIKNQTLFLHPLEKWHLRNEYKNWVNIGGKIEYVKLFGVIGIFVLLIACVNFMNLSTARSEKRAKEVGIRKAIGSGRRQLIFQFLFESVFTSFLAFLLSLGLIKLLLPLLSELGFKNIQFDFGNIYLIGAGLAVCLVVGLIAGSYPALYFASFVPVKVLKGIFRQGKFPVIFRKVLVVSQFVVSIGLVVGTVIVFLQVKHARNRSIGYNPDNLISVVASTDLANNFNSLKQDLLNTGYIESVSKASQPMTVLYNKWSDFSWKGKEPDADIAIDAVMTEWDFEKTVGLEFVKGRPFSREFKTDSNGVILNEAALEVIGYKDPIGKTMKSGNREINIVGIVKNIVLSDPFKPVSPLAILFNGSTTNNVNAVLLRLNPSVDLRKALSTIEPVFDKYNPSLPFEYSFADEEFARKFTTENQVGKLAGIFAGLAIFISCLGLFGLTAFMVERRNKEIGIRKVLGASGPRIWLLLSKEHIWLVFIASVIASALTYWLMNNWLEQYDYRITISIWVFALAILLAMVIAILTVSTQAIKAAMINPIKSLRSE